MKKFLLIISLVLISLLAVGAVSVNDMSNSTDDSLMQTPSVDINEQSVADDFKEKATQEI